MAQAVAAEMEAQAKRLPRWEIIQESVRNYGIGLVFDSLEDACVMANKVAPEHLEVVTEQPRALLPLLKNAGAIFLGEQTSEPIGDYLAGPNHTLPTGGSAKFFSPLSTEHFMKKSSIIAFSKQGIAQMGQECGILAHTEGLDAHQNAVLARLNNKGH